MGLSVFVNQISFCAKARRTKCHPYALPLGLGSLNFKHVFQFLPAWRRHPSNRSLPQPST